MGRIEATRNPSFEWNYFLARESFSFVFISDGGSKNREIRPSCSSLVEKNVEGRHRGKRDPYLYFGRFVDDPTPRATVLGIKSLKKSIQV